MAQADLTAFTIRHTRPADIDVVLRVYDAARAFMRRTGNMHQWADGYPSRSTLETDMAEGHSYVIEADGRVVATFYFRVGPDPTYAVITEGQWLNSRAYGVVHRAASDGTLRGVMTAILDHCRALCPELRVDTHRDNRVMQRILEAYGFVRCGIIYLASGDPRIAYQLAGGD